LAIHRITSITVGVPDVTQAAAWYREFGLAEAADGRFSSRDGGEQLVLEQAQYRGLLKFGVGVDDPDDLDRIESQINLLDIEARVGRQGNVLRVDDPIDKIPIEVSVALAHPGTNRPHPTMSSSTVALASRVPMCPPMGS